VVAGLTLGLAGRVAAEDGVQIIPDVIYGHKDGMAMTLDVFKPQGKTNGAGLLFMVSGGWVSRWSPPERTVQRFRELLDRGFTVFAVRHGSSPRYKVPEAVADVRRAVRYVRHNSSQFAVDPDRLGVYGGSAGGHLSLMLATASDDGQPGGQDEIDQTPCRVACVVAYFPPVDLRPIVGPSERFPALDFNPELAESVSPIVHVTADDPPALLVHGDQDELVPLDHSRRIKAAFDKEGVKSELIVIEGAGHGFRGEAAERAQSALIEWFEKHLLN